MREKAYSPAKYLASSFLTGVTGITLLAAIFSSTMFAQTRPAGLPTLTTARAAHRLTAQEAARKYPVHLHAVVTYYDPYIDPRRAALFVVDSTGGVFVALSRKTETPLRAGELVDVTGVSGTGDFAPIVDNGEAHAIGKSHLPTTAPRVSMTRLLTGEEDGQWVEIDGIVRSIEQSDKNIILNLALNDGEISALTLKQHGVDYAALVDAKVRLRGNAAPLFTHRRQMTGAHLLFPDLSTIAVQEPAPAHPFESQIHPLDDLLRFSPDGGSRHRAHIRGAVTLFWPGRVLCIHDGPLGLCAQTAQTTPLKPGELVDVLGFPDVGDFTPTLTNAEYRATGDWRPAPALAVDADQALRAGRDAELVQLDVQFLGLNKASKDPTLVLSSGDIIFNAVLPRQLKPQDLPAWEEGSTLRIAGICSVQSDSKASLPRENSAASMSFRAMQRIGFSVPKSFRIMLRSPQDVVVVRKPSWWNAANTLRVLALALCTIVLAAVALFFQVRKGRETASELRREIGERQRAEEATKYALDQMEYQAHHDPLTSLANRLMFNRSMRDALAFAARTGSCVGLLYLDLDRFKTINDSLGHAAGDLLLRQAAQRLTSVSPPGSLLARLGGDEFAFLLPGTGCRSHAEEAALRVIEVLAGPFEIEGSFWHCPASIGLSMFPEDAASAVVLQRNADTALYRAKRTAPGHVVAFDRSMSEQAERSVFVEKALRNALEANDFSLVYQPQFGRGGDLRGFEALLRLNDRILGELNPIEFIPVAEDLGLIDPIGEWVLQAACHQWAAWAREGATEVFMAVNVSSVQLTRGDFPALVRRVLAETGMPAASLEIELTETGILTNAHETLLELKAIGIRIAVDDFGTGFSSLSSLHKTPVDCVKIDRSFVRDAASTPGTLPFIRTIVSLARSLGMKTVAEGVETSSQMEAVKSAGCDLLQGYLLSYPLTAADATRLLSVCGGGLPNAFQSEPLVGAR